MGFLLPHAHRSISHFYRAKPTVPFGAFHNNQTFRNLILEPLSESVKIKRFSGSDSGIVEVNLDRAAAKNAIGNEMLRGLQLMVKLLHGNSDVRVLILSSSVPKVFSAGADLKERRLMSAAEVKQFVNTLRATFTSLEALHAPTIAVVEGAALGGGMELALSCDIRICGADALFGLPETGLAIIPGAGGTQRLPRLVGKSRAKELIFTGRKISSHDAASMGLVNYCVPSGEAYGKAFEVAQNIIQKGPLAIQMAKIAIDNGMEMNMSSARQVEEDCYDQVLNSEDRLEGLAAFAEKRTPIYTGK